MSIIATPDDFYIGIVKSVFPHKFFGFISGHDKKEYFFHFHNSTGKPLIGDLVFFRKIESNKYVGKLSAIQVLPIRTIKNINLLKPFFEVGEPITNKQKIIESLTGWQLIKLLEALFPEGFSSLANEKNIEEFINTFKPFINSTSKKMLSNWIIEKGGRELHLKLFFDGTLDTIGDTSFILKIFDNLSEDQKKIIISRISNSDMNVILENRRSKVTKPIETYEEYESFRSCFVGFQQFFIDYKNKDIFTDFFHWKKKLCDESSKEFHVRFFIDGVTEYISNDLITDELKHLNYEQLEELFSKLDQETLLHVLSKIQENFDNYAFQIIFKLIAENIKFVEIIYAKSTFYTVYESTHTSYKVNALGLTIQGKETLDLVKNKSKDGILFQKIWEIMLLDLKRLFTKIAIERVQKNHLITEFLFSIVRYCSPVISQQTYELSKSLFKMIEEAIETSVLTFSSKSTRESRNKALIIDIYQPLKLKIFSQAIPYYNLCFSLDGFNSEIDEKFVISNYRFLDKETIHRLLQLNQKRLNQRLFEEIIDEIKFIDSDNEFFNLKELLYQVKTYLPSFLNEITQRAALKCTQKYSFHLWLEGYISQFDEEYVNNVFHESQELVKQKIIGLLPLDVTARILINEISVIKKIDDKRSYSLLKEVLIFFRKFAPSILNELEITEYIKIDYKFMYLLWIDGFNIPFTIEQIINQLKPYYDNSNPEKVKVGALSTLKRRLNNLGQIETDNQFLEVATVLRYINSYFSKSDFEIVSKELYYNNTDFCKIKMYIFEFVNLSKEDFCNDIESIFKGQFFRLLREEKKKFLKLAKNQLPDFNLKIRDDINPSEIIEKMKDGKVVLNTKFRDVLFFNGAFAIKIDDDTWSEAFSWDFSKIGFNLLRRFFSKQNADSAVRITVLEKKIIPTSDLALGLLEFKKQLLVIFQRFSYDDSVIKIGLPARSEYSILSNKDIKRITHEENGECVRFLFDYQSEAFRPIYVIEWVQNEKNPMASTHIGSWLFSFILPSNEILIVWESEKLDRATHLFRCKPELYPDVINKIEKYLAESEGPKRIRFSGDTIDDIELKQNLFYFGHINHDHMNNCERWYCEILRFIPAKPGLNPPNESWYPTSTR
ncbi:MAG: hypothetical protein J0M29_19845 [Chitinophagales bacterium]|nr:hypothetical protein [Chitinophagales bacterium]